METGQRRLLAAVGAVLLGAALVAGAAAGINQGGDEQARSGAAVTSTTYSLVPVTGGPAITPPTTRPPAPTVPPPQPATTVPAPAAAGLSASGAILTRPSNPGARPINKAEGCRSLADRGWKVVECGALRTSGIVLEWLVQRRGHVLQAMVLREQAAGSWVPVLSARSDGSAEFGRVGVRGGDATGDGENDLAFGFHRPKPGNVLRLDVVEAPGVVTLHRELPGGSARIGDGALITWKAEGDSARRDTLSVVGERWRIQESESVPADSVPPSMV